MLVHISRPPEGEFLPVLQAGIADTGVRISLGPDAPPVSATDVLVSGRPTAQELAACPALRALVVPYAGVPRSTVELVRARPGLTLHNLHHNAAPTAEHAVGLLLAAARRIVPCDAALRRNDWTARYQDERGLLLEGRRAVVLGMGEIGRRIARALEGLGMRVDGIRRRPAPGEHGPEALRKLLVGADVLMICLPATAETEGLIGAEELALMPAHGVLVNVARGGVVDQAALFEALQGGRLGAAGLDVWWRYPKDEAGRMDTPPADLPFAELDSVVLSPHRAGHCDRTERLRGEHLAGLLRAMVAGDWEKGLVDLSAGY